MGDEMEKEEEIYLEMTLEWTNRFRKSKAVQRLISKRSHRMRKENRGNNA